MTTIDLRDWPNGHYEHYKYMMFMMPIILNAHTIVETGFKDGQSTQIFLKALEELSGDRKLYTYETTNHLTDADETIRVRILRRAELFAEYHKIWHIVDSDSVDGAINYTGEEVDFLYLDSDHKREHVYRELTEWNKHLSDKSIIMIDDAFDYSKQVPTGPMLAAQAWLGEVPQKIKFDGNKWTPFSWKLLAFTEKHGPIVLYK